MTFALYVLVGLAAGAVSGLVGVGGGIVIVPALVMIFGLSQHQAQGTSLAVLIPPVGLLAAWTYYRQGHVDVKMALFIALGFVLGGLLGAKVSVHIPNEALRRVFGVVLLAVGVKMTFFK